MLLDLKFICDGGIEEILEETALYSFGFIWALLTGNSDFYGRQTIGQVQSAVRARQNTCVFFLDDYPSPYTDEGFETSRYLRLMRNIFRAFGLVTILSCTHGTARNLISQGEEPHDIHESLLCVVFPLFLRFKDELIPSILSSVFLNSRPQFAKTALKHIQANPMNEATHLVEYIDSLVAAVADDKDGWRPTGFCVGRLLQFLPSSFAADIWGRFTDGHYATLREQSPFELQYNQTGKLVKNDESQPWEPLTALPPVENDVLLYLSFTGGRMFRALTTSICKPIPFHQALSDVLR